jgi:glycosyltransferase involved in cell wall biosynthesis
MTITAIVCAYNEGRHLPACLFSLLAQTRPPDEILIINNASTDDTGSVARAIALGVATVRVIDEPAKGLVVARETARRAARGSVLAYVDADCRVPLRWLERVEAQLAVSPSSLAVTGPYRFYDWDFAGRVIIGLYDVLVAPATHVLVHHAFGVGAILYGGNFAVRAEALERIGGFDRTIEFHGEDTNLGRRLTAIGRVRMCPDCWVWTSARRYVAMGKRKVFSLYVRNFWSEILRHRPADREHLDVRV